MDKSSSAIAKERFRDSRMQEKQVKQPLNQRLNEQLNKRLDKQPTRQASEQSGRLRDQPHNQRADAPPQQTRRDFLSGGLSAGAGAALLAGTTAFSTSPAQADDFFASEPDTAGGQNRAVKAYGNKVQAARQHLLSTFDLPPQLSSGDEERYAEDNYYASFSKTLPHNELGEVNTAAYESMVRALRSGENSDFDAIPLAANARRGLANPQGAFRFETAGLDSHATRLAPSNTFRSAEFAGEMAEVYWQALTRDVPFSQYDSNPVSAEAVADLSSLSAPPGAMVNGMPTSANLFRGETPGDLVGPYISQFLWLPFSIGSIDVEQRYESGVAGLDFMTDAGNWLNIQRGGAPSETAVVGEKTFIHTNRALAEYVHRDLLYQAYLNAAVILLGLGGAARDTGNPYSGRITNQGAFTSLGGPFIIDMVSKAGNMSLSGAWFQKWRVHRFLRPEACGGRVHYHMNGRAQYELPAELLNSAAVAETFRRNGTYFCPQAYIEGSPTHPSYPAGHATIAGACVTVLKAFFNEDFVLPNPVVANDSGDTLLPWTGDDLTIGGELNKLANNISLGRDAAGVHYRQDGVQGLFGGEQQALSLLQDHTRSVTEAGFEGFELTLFDGQRVRVVNGNVTPV